MGDIAAPIALLECQFESAELAGEERDDGVDGWGRDEEGVDAVDYAVRAELDRQWLVEQID